ncbi:hypothetical protein [Alloyangia pacifica]|uniref:hypothetical protein n=1 Tax=Alloyangia pacifica TaxID=311180 RepID=UPI00115F92C2|nr:hypothetical protein [Alloyangia pacifica]
MTKDFSMVLAKGPKAMTIENAIKGFTALVGLAGFVFGVVKFLEVMAVDAERPYLERKLAWCEQVVETTSRIATSAEASQDDIDRFWQMYWGVMGLIEKASITSAMVEFGKSLEAIPSAEEGSKDLSSHLSSMQGKSLSLAHACRKELSAEWSPSWSITP